MTASQVRPESSGRSRFRSPCSFSTSGKSSGFVLPRLKSVSSWPRASAASVIARPRNFVPPRIRSLNGTSARRARRPRRRTRARRPGSARRRRGSASSNWKSSGSRIGRKPYVWTPAREKKRPSVTPIWSSGIGIPSGSSSRITPARVSNSPRSGSDGPGSCRTSSSSTSRPTSSCTSPISSSGVKPGSARPSSSSSISLGTTLIFCAAADDRGVDGVPQHRLDRRSPLAEQPQRRVGQPRLQQHPQHRRLLARQLRGDPIDELAHDRRHVHRHALPVEVGEQLPEPRDRAAAVHHRAVPARPADGRLQPADLLLRHLDRIEALAAEVEA